MMLQPRSNNFDLVRRPELALLAMSVAYLILSFCLANAPLQDLPNHLARAHIIADLWFNPKSVYSSIFYVKISLAPYLAGDVLLSLLDHFLGTEWAARVWIAIAVLALPAATWFVMRMMNISGRNAVAWSILAFYISTDWFFVMGFMNYQMAIAALLIAYGLFLRAKNNFSLWSYLSYVLAITCAYCLHLSALVFGIALFSASAAVSMFKGRLDKLRAAALLAPPYLLFGTQVLKGADSDYSKMLTLQPDALLKLLRVASPFLRFDRVLDAALLIAITAAMLSLIVMANLRRKFLANEQLVYAGLFFCIYFALPRILHGVYDVDNRALPYAFLFFMFAGAQAADLISLPKWLPLAVCMLFASINLIIVAARMIPEDSAMQNYKAIAAEIPVGAKVLPINTRPIIGRYQPFIHAGSYATSMSAALTPYIFAGNTSSAQSYFKYYEVPDAPAANWYTDGHPGDFGQPNWPQIKSEYQYLLVTVPWKAAVFSQGYRIVASNDVAALLAINP